MTHKSKITPEQLAVRQQEFLRSVFGDKSDSISADDCIQAAWRDAFKLPAAMQNPFYVKTASEDSRAVLRDFAKQKAMGIAKKVHKPCDFVCDVQSAAAEMLAEWGVSVTHIGHITELRDAVTEVHGGIIAGGRLTFGRAQKLLNMYLKYMWCAQKISETPPHCPFDDIIINKVGLPHRDDSFWGTLGGLENLEQQPQHGNIWTWTKSNSERDYLVWLAAAEYMRRRDKIYASLAEWELFVFPQGDC